MEFDAFTARSREVWDTGDYAPTSRQLEPAAETLVDALGVTSAHTVLDVAAGDGNCAIAAARRGATVTASDFAPRMVVAGRRRTEGLDLAISRREADAADLPFPDGSFDRVTSVFGIIFAPDQRRAASEAVRVTLPGGQVGVTAWPPDDVTARSFAIVRSFLQPLPAGSPDPLDWGRPEHVAALVAPAECAIDICERTLTFRYRSWDDWRASGEAHGLSVVARRSTPPERYQAMTAEITAVIEQVNRGEAGAVVYDARYLEIVLTVG